MLQFDRLKFLDTNGKPIEVRSKQFGELFTKDNFFKCFSKLSLDQSHELKVCSMDITKDVYLDRWPVNEFLGLLFKTPFHSFQTELYTTRGNSKEGKRTGIVIRSKFRKSGGSSVRLTLYDKYEETKEERYKGVLRLELKLTTFKSIRQKLNIPTNTLFEVLHSQTDPIENLLTTIHNSIMNNEAQPMTNELRLEQLHAWFQSFDYNWTAIHEHLQATCKSESQIKTVRKQFQVVSRLKNNLNYTDLFNQLSKVKHKAKAPEPNQNNPNQLKLIA